MYSEDISNRMLYDLITDFKKDVDHRFEAIDHRFESMDRRFESMDRRFEAIERKFESLEAKVDRNHESLEAKVDRNHESLEAKIDRNSELIYELHKKADKVEISFSRKVLLGNGVFAGIIAFFVAIFTGRMIIET